MDSRARRCIRPCRESVGSHCVLARAVVAFAVEVNEDVAWLGAFARADVAAFFEDVHDAGGAAVADLEPALQERDAGLLLAADDLDALLDEFLVLAFAFLGVEGLRDAVRRPLQRVVDFHLVAGLALLGDEV